MDTQCYVQCVHINFLNSIDSSTYFTLAKQSRELGAYKLARYAYEKLQVKHIIMASIMSVHISHFMHVVPRQLLLGISPPLPFASYLYTGPCTGTGAMYLCTCMFRSFSRRWLSLHRCVLLSTWVLSPSGQSHHRTRRSVAVVYNKKNTLPCIIMYIYLLNVLPIGSSSDVLSLFEHQSPHQQHWQRVHQLQTAV